MELIDFLKNKVTLFEDFSDSNLTDLIEGSDLVYFEENEAAIEFGEQGRFLGVLIEGEAEVSVTDSAGTAHHIDTLKPGDVFGEISLMTGNNTIADVIGKTRMKALIIPQSLFSSLLVTNIQAIRYISRLISERLAKYGETGTARVNTEELLMLKADPFGFKLKTSKPRKVLALVPRESYLGYSLFDTGDSSTPFSGTIEGIESDKTIHTIKGKSARTIALGRIGFPEAIKSVYTILFESGVISDQKGGEVSLVGLLVAHGGSSFSGSVIIDENIIKEIEALSSFAPANSISLQGIRESMKLFPGATHVAVFDTAFHHTLPSYAYLYGLPFEFYEKDRVRRYGFHGAIHSYVSLKASEYLKRPYNSLEIITANLGNDASMCAVDHGRSVDTSMGFSSSDGLVMGTKSGSFDPGALIHIARANKLSIDEIETLINRSSGLLGISGIQGSIDELESKAMEGNSRAILAVKSFAYQVRKYIGAYAAGMAGLDVIAFAGSMAETSPGIRSLACQGLGILGIVLDETKNKNVPEDSDVFEISAINSRVKVLVVKSDEERMIAREAVSTVNRKYVSEILSTAEKMSIPIEVSAHHVHLSEDHIAILFGAGYALTKFHDLSQPGQFACNETVNLIGPKGRIERVRILGPARKATQVEIAMTEQFKLGISAPIRESGDIAGSPGITIEGPKGTVTVEQGVICALRHVHMSPEEALRYGLFDKDFVRIRIEGDRELIFGDVLIRVNPQYRLAMHIDTDEGNAADIKTGITGYIDGIQNRG
jgi:acetate kinase